MISPKDFAAHFGRGADTLRKFSDGLTHEDSLLQPHQIEGNCLNWIVGHLLNSRNTVLRMSGAPERQWQQVVGFEAMRARYGNGSQAIKTDGPDVLKLPQLLAGLNHTQEQINQLLGGASTEQAAVEIEALGRKMPLDNFWMYMFGHEQYHIGQLEYVRPLSGHKNP